MPVCDDVQPAAGAPGETHTRQQNDLGTRRHFSDGNYYVYLKGNTGVVGGDCCQVNEGNTLIRSTLTTLGPVAWATAPCGLNQFGWCFVAGLMTINAASVAVADTPPYATATPGVLDDTVVAGSRVHNAIFRSSGTGTATIRVGFGGAHIASDL